MSFFFFSLQVYRLQLIRKRHHTGNIPCSKLNSSQWEKWSPGIKCFTSGNIYLHAINCHIFLFNIVENITIFSVLDNVKKYFNPWYNCNVILNHSKA